MEPSDLLVVMPVVLVLIYMIYLDCYKAPEPDPELKSDD
jgi:hypothetical protein